MEAHFHSSSSATGLYLFGWPDSDDETVHFGIQLPSMLSSLVHDNFSEPVRALDTFPAEGRPPVWLPFQMFHLMVAIGSMLIGLSATGLLFRWKGTFETQRLLLWLFVFAPVAAMVAHHAGWITAEVGRQPWIVYPSVQDGVEMMGLRTKDGLSESVTAQQVLGSIVMFGIIYSLLFMVGIYVLNAKIQHGPESVESLAELKRKQKRQSLTESISHGGTSCGGSLMEDD